MKKCLILFAVMLLASISMAANPVTVGSTGDFTTIQAAIESWCDGGANEGETPPFVIDVDPAATYDEAICLDDAFAEGNIVGALTIQSATPGTKVLLKLQRALNGSDDGIVLHQSRFNISFTDIVFCPSLTGTVITDDMIKIDENSGTTPSIYNKHTFTNCIFTDIDASGTPKVTSKQEIIDMTYPADLESFVSGSSLGSGDMLMKCWNDADENLDLLLDNCGFFVKNGYCARIIADGIGQTRTVKDCVFATGLSWHAALQVDPNNAGGVGIITGTQSPRLGDLDKCTAILSAGWHAIWCDGTGAGGNTVTINNVLIDNDDIWGTDDSRPIAAGGCDLTVSDVIMAVYTDPGNIVDYPTNVTTNDKFERCTIHMPGVANWLYTGGSPDPGGIDFIDCVFSGAGMGGYASAGPPAKGVNLINCGIATSGADAFTTIGLVQSLTNCVFGDPGYISKDRKNANYMDTTAAGYFLAASDAGSIGGGANYTVADASDNVQNVFKSIGDCEGDIITQASTSSGYGDAALPGQQDPVPGVIGNACYIWYSGWTRVEGSTVDIPVALTGNDQTFSFYYKQIGLFSTYPYIALRQNPPTPETGRVDSATGWVLWNSATAPFTVDSQWHIYNADISVPSPIIPPAVASPPWPVWDGVLDADLFVNLISTSGIKSTTFDEIVLDDPNVDTRVDD